MKKMTRASIAGVAGLGLLAGGVTFATWSDEETVPGANIASGSLSLEEVTTGKWHNVTGGQDTEIGETLVGFTVVPGHDLEYRTAYKVGASGDNLTANLTVVGVEEGVGGSALAEAVDVTNVFRIIDPDDGEDVPETVTGTATIGSDNDNDEVDVVVGVSIPEGALNLEEGQLETLELTAGSVVLDQTSPVQPVD